MGEKVERAKEASNGTGKPDAAAVYDTRKQIVAFYAKDWRDEAEDIASEAIARAWVGYEPERGPFATFAFGCARNVVRERTRHVRRERGERAPKPDAPPMTADLLGRLDPSAVSTWFRFTRLGCEDRTIYEAIDYTARRALIMLSEAHDDPSGGWGALHAALVAKAAEALDGEADVTADDVIWSVLRAIGLSGTWFDSYTKPTRRLDARHAGAHERALDAPTHVRTLADFFDEACIVSPEACAGAAELHEAYSAFSTSRGVEPLAPKAFGELLVTLPGVERRRTKAGNVYRGLGAKKK